MKQIDYPKINEEANKMGISPHLIIKRKFNYRKCKKSEVGCKFCINLRFVDYGKPNDFSRRKQCFIIGESIDPYSDVGYDYTCDVFTRI